MGLGEFGPWHLLIVAFVFVLLFGSKKLPDAARSVGRSLRIFKAETRGLRDDEAAAHELPAAAAAAPPADQRTSDAGVAHAPSTDGH